MSEFWVMRRGNALIPHTAESDAVIARLPLGKPIQVKAKQPRNARHSALYWVLCHRIADAVGSEAENVSDILKISSGHCAIVKSKKYGEVRLPRSISFAAMSQTDFSRFFETCIQTIQTEWAIDQKDIQDIVADLLHLPDEAR